MGASQALKVGQFIASITPDLIATGQALFHALKGDVQRARGVLQIVRDHGARLDAERLELDRELAEMRAERAREKEQS